MRLPIAALVAGSVLLSGSAALATTTACSSVAACLLGTDAANGPGVAGTSVSGFGVSGSSQTDHGVNGFSAASFGVVGITIENATTVGTARSGVLGEDLSTNKNNFNDGVAGSSAYGAGVYGSSTHTTGVLGSSPSVGICGESDITHTTEKATLCQTSGPVGVSGNSNKGWGLFGFSDVGDGLEGLSINGIAGIISNLNDKNPALIVAGGTESGPARAGRPLFVVEHSNSPAIFAVDQVGNVTIGGTLTEGASPQIRTATRAGAFVTSYGARESLPTLEDFGQGRLRGGSGYVRLEPTYAGAIDPRSSYMVFLTPNGNSNGLYVSNKTVTGFEVHENASGRSTVAFDYRIVAKPADAAGTRLAADHAGPGTPYALPRPTLSRVIP